jgi:hypothetical protein
LKVLAGVENVAEVVILQRQPLDVVAIAVFHGSPPFRRFNVLP